MVATILQTEQLHVYSTIPQSVSYVPHSKFVVLNTKPSAWLRGEPQTSTAELSNHVVGARAFCSQPSGVADGLRHLREG
jgi:hypothetical protein